MVTSPESAALPSGAELRAIAGALWRDDLVIVPVRHHSPASALQLRRLLAARPPSAVLIEGPRSCTDLVPLLVHAETAAPFAVYTYAVARDAAGQEVRRAAYYPFCDHSPELVAVREAVRLALPVQFIDLEFAEQCQVDAARAGDQADDVASLLDEHHLQKSRHLLLLAERLGCRDVEELWEHLFEVDALATPPAEHCARVAAFCELARREYNAEELAADGTLPREAEMCWHVRQALAARAPRAGPVVVVVGGFHAVALPALLAAPPARPHLPGGDFVRRDTALVRYAFDRLERLNGYAAGMTSPRWHQLVWERLLLGEQAGVRDDARARQDSALAVLHDVAAQLREKHQVPLPMPTVQAAYEHALRLAALRRRGAPVREDVLDAVIGCYIKGDADADGALIRAVAQRTLTGIAVGRVPAGASTPPLVRDFAFRARRQRLKLDDSEPRRLALDLYRRAEHRVTSRLLHGLMLLGVPFATRTAGPDFVRGRHLDRLQEQWSYSYSPATEAALVEASVHGATLPLAVARRFIDRLDALAREGCGQDARAAATMLTHGCVLGLHEQMPRLLEDLRRAIAGDADFAAVAGAAATIGLLWESREPLEARELDELPALLQATYERATFLGRDLRAAPAEAEPHVQALLQLRELLASGAGTGLEPALYWDLVEGMHRHQAAPLLRGAAAGLLHGAGRLAAADLAATLTGQLRSAARGSDAVAWLRGLLGTARELAWQEAALLGALDELLTGWGEQEFVALLPELRLAFATLTPKETDRVGAAVAARHGVADLGQLVRHDVDAAAVQRHLQLSALVRETLAADGLAGWGAP